MRLTAIPTDEVAFGDSNGPSPVDLGPAFFAALMAACGPFENKPHLAVGVSGGPDSVALMLLLAGWVQAQGGKLTALTVDHGLRADSTTEAEAVAGQASRAGIDHRILAWSGAKPQAGLQAAARRARYDLLTSWCRDAGVLHLAVAHHQDDQRETVAMRRARKGADGAGSAGMSLIAARHGVRLLRPLLPIPAAALKAYLRANGQDWIDDPSNRLERFERIRWRHGLEGPTPAPDAICTWGEARVEMEETVADLLMRSVSIHGAGFVLADLSVWRRAAPAILTQGLGQLVAMVAGRDYLPTRAALARVAGIVLSGDAAVQSLGGTLIGTWRGLGVICREPAAVTDDVTLAGPAGFLWDRRFQVDVEEGVSGRVVALGDSGVAEIGQNGLFRLKDRDIPPLARASLPALRDATGRLSAVPHLGFDPYGQGSCVHFRFWPYYSATSSGFTVAHGWPHTI